MKADIYYRSQQWPTTWPYFEGGERNPYLGSFRPCHEQKPIPTIYTFDLKSVLFSLTIQTKSFMSFPKDTYIKFDYLVQNFTAL